MKKTDAYGRITVTTRWKGFDITGKVVVNDWEGDASLPGGLHNLGPYVDEFTILAPDGSDLFDYLSPDAETEICQKLIDSVFDWR